MGLFSSKKKIIVNTTVQRVFEDTAIPDSARLGMVRALTSSSDIVENILEEFSGSMGVRADQAFKWAQDNQYPPGIPTSKAMSSIDIRSAVLTVLQQMSGNVRVLYNNFGPINLVHYGFQYCSDNWAYEVRSNELIGLSAIKGWPVFLYDIVPVFSAETANWMFDSSTLGELESWGYAPTSGYAPSRAFNTISGMGQYNESTPYMVDPYTNTDYIEITYEWEQDVPGVVVPPGGIVPKEIKSEKIRIPITMDLDADYVQARYIRPDDSTGFFTYKHGAGTRPTLDSVFNFTYDANGTYYPWVYLRRNGRRMSDTEPDTYRKGRTYSKFLGVDLDQIDNGVHQDNNVSDVEQCIMFFGVQPDTTNQFELEYLFEYMKELSGASAEQIDKAQFLVDLFGDYSNTTDQVIRILDRFFEMKFSYSGIKWENKAGVLGAVGKYYGEALMASTSSGMEATIQPAYRYRKQSMASMYEEVTIFNPRLSYAITSKKGHVAKQGDKELLFPLDRGVLSRISLRKKEVILSRSLHMCVNTMVQVKSPWYASSFFRAIMIIVAIIVTVYSAGTAWSSIAAAAAVGVTAVSWVIIQYIVVAMAINYSVKLFVKALGPEYAFIAAIAAMAIGVYGMNNNAVWGETLVGISSNISEQVVTAAQVGLTETLQELSAFNSFASDAFDSLEESRRELGLTFDYTGLSGLDFVGYRPMTIMGESPDEMYTRTIHSGNVGAASLGITEMFFDAKLTLPRISETVGNEDF